MTEETATVGIMGNTQQTEAANEATVARQATKVAWQESWVTHTVIGAMILAVAYILLYNLEWNFFLKLAVGYAVFYASGKLSGSKIKMLGQWPTVGKGVGLGIMLLAGIQSGFFKMAEKGVNIVEQKAAVIAGTAPATPDPLPTIQTLESLPNRPYATDRNFHKTVIIPANGSYFTTEAGCGLDYNDQIMTAVPVGRTENPWAVILLQPKFGHEQQATVSAFCPPAN